MVRHILCQVGNKMTAHTVRRLLAMAAIAGLGISVPLAQADLQWDPGHTPLSSSGGAGTWNLAAANWSDGLVDRSWDGSVAIFSAPGGTVTLGDPIAASGLMLSSEGYTLAASNSSNMLSFSNEQGPRNSQEISTTGAQAKHWR
jgi:hypothetical protein